MLAPAPKEVHMYLLFKIEDGHSADAVLIGNVVDYKPMDKACKNWIVTYIDKGELMDICVGHVTHVEEVQ